MTELLALDVAILPPADVVERAIRLSAQLPRAESKGLLLGPAHMPHVTLTQQFVRADEIDEVCASVGNVLSDYPPIPLQVTGGGQGKSSVWMQIDPSAPLVRLHTELMEALRGFERPAGTAAAFLGADARFGDVMWVTGYRLKSSLQAFNPHITLGHAKKSPPIQPFTFEATTVAACHLGKFCTCRKILRSWTLV